MKIKIIRQQAQDENTAPETLVQLANSEDYLTRQYVASNSNIPTEILLNLGAEFPRELIHNPIFDLLIIEEIDVINKMPLATLRSILRQQTVPNFILEQAGNRSDHEIQLSLANNINTSTKILEKLAYKLSQYIDNRIPTNQIQSKTINKLRDTTECQILQAIACHPNASQQLLEYLAAENCPIIHQNILKYQNLSKKAIDIISFIQGKLRKNPRYLLESLATDNRAEVRKLIARNSNTPIKILTSLAKDKKLSVLLALAQNNKTPKFILESLAIQLNKDIIGSIPFL